MDKQGNLGMYHWIRKSSITGITEVPVDGTLAGPQGDVIKTLKAAVDVGTGSLLTNSTVEEILTALDPEEGNGITSPKSK
jgi:hypothetical protein